MITCTFEAGKITCQREAEKSVGVKRGNVVVWQADVCAAHVATMVYEAMEHARVHGGAVSTVDIRIPARKPSNRVTVGTDVPRDDHRRLVIVSQHMDMSQRAWLRRAINNQLTIDELRARGHGS